MKLSSIIISAILLAGCSNFSTRELSEPGHDIEIKERLYSKAPASKASARPAPMMAPPTPKQNTENKRSSLQISESQNSVSAKLFSASLAFAVPDKANVNDALKAQLLIDTTEELDKLEKQLTVKGTVVKHKIRVSKVVKATLTAPNFEVVKITDEEQVLTDQGITEWLWTLVPNTAGTHEINLTVTAVITLDGRESKHHLKTFDRTVVIEITKEQILASWWQKHWQWVISTLLLPLLGFLFKDKIKKLIEKISS